MAEYSYDQVMTALRNADAAGDTEAATRLASIAKGLQTPKQEAAPVEPQAPQPSLLDKAIGVGEAALSTGTGLIGGSLAGAVGVGQQFIDSALKGQLSSPQELSNKYNEQAAMATYEPRTDVGKDYTGTIGDAIATHGPSLMSVFPQLETMSALSRFKKPTAQPKADLSPEAQKILAERQAAQKATVAEVPAQPLKHVDQLQREGLDAAMSESGLIKDFVPDTTEQPLPFVPELYDGEAPLLPKVKETWKPTVPEAERIAAEREAMLEKPLRWRKHADEMTQPEVFFPELPIDEGLPFTRSDKLSLPVEVNRFSRDVQQGIRDVASTADDIKAMREELANKTEVGPEQQLAIQSAEHDLNNAQLRTKAASEEATQAGREMGQLRIKNGNEEPRIPYQFGKGQRGSINPEVFMEGFQKMKDLVTEGLKGVRLVAYNTDPKNFYITAKSWNGKDIGEIHFVKNGENLTSDVTIVGSQYRGKGLSDAMYKYASELGNDVEASKNQTAGGAKMWDRFQKSGLASETPTGQRMIAKGQRGSIGFFGKDPYEVFAENLRKEIPDVTEAEIKKAWEGKQKLAAPEINKQAQQANQGQVFKSITGYDPKYTGEVWTPEKAVDVLSTVPDIESRSFAKEQFASSGRLQRDLLNHPAVTWIYNLTNKAVEHARLQARKVLDDQGTGSIPQIRKHVTLSFSGAKEMRELLKWRFNNEGTGATLPDTFSSAARKINDMLNKADEQLISKMNESLAKDGKKPITALDNHMVHYWSGPYRAYIYLKTSSGGSRLGFFVSEKSMKDAQAAMKWIKENVPNVDMDKTSGISFVKADARARSSMFDHLLDISNETDPTVLQALQQFKERVQAAQETHLSEHYRQQRRQGVKGFLGNKPWLSEARNYADSVESIRTKYDAGYQWIAAQEIRQAMEPVLKAQQEGKISVGKAIALGQKYVDHALGKNVDTSAITKMMDYLEEMSPNLVGRTRRGINFTHDLFGRVTLPYLLALKGTQAAQSVLQVGQATIPRMLEMQRVYNGNPIHIATSLAHGSMDGMFQLANALTLGKFEPMTRQLLQMVDKDLSSTSLAIHKAVQDFDIARMSLSDTGVSKEGGAIKSFANAVAERTLDTPMNLFEGPTRTWAFSSFVRQAVKDGHSIESAIQLGKEAMDTMTNYNPEAGAMGLANLGVVGREARGLHTFMINYYTQLARYVKVAKESRNPGPLLSYLGITLALGGATGFIGADLADWLLDEIKTAMRGTKYDNPDLQKFTLRKWMLDTLPESISVGPLSSATGLGLYGSFTTKVIDPDRTFLDNMFPKTKASLQIAQGVLESPKLLNPDLTDKERGNIIEKLAPKFMTQAIRNRYQNKDGTVYDPGEGRAGLPMYQRTPKEQSISEHGFGVRGLAENLAQEDTMNLLKGQKNVSDSQKQQVVRFDKILVSALKNGDKVTAFQRNALNEQAKALVETWGVDANTLNSHIQKVAQDYGINSDTLRRIVNIKTVNAANAPTVQELSNMNKRQKERQQRYGQ